MFNGVKVVSLFLLVANKITNFLSSDSDPMNIKNKKIYSGYDERHDITLTEKNITLLNEIRKYIIKKNIIEKLECNTTNINEKINIIEKYTDAYSNKKKITEFNLFAGNLLNNFYDNQHKYDM